MKKYTKTKQKSYAAGRRKKNSRRAPKVVIMKMKLKKGDHVIVVSGKDKGKEGKILTVFPKLNRIVVDGIGMVKRHLKSSGRGQSGRIVEHPAAISASNVMLIDHDTKKPTRVGRTKQDGKNVRVTKKSKTVLK